MVENYSRYAIKIQSDHKLTTDSAVEEKYLTQSQSRDWFEERERMIQWTADYIDKEIAVFNGA